MIIMTIDRDGKKVDVVGVQDPDGRVHPTNQKVARVGKETLRQIEALRQERKNRADTSFLEESASFIAWMLCFVPPIVGFMTDGWTWVRFAMIPVFVVIVGVAVGISMMMDDRARRRRIEYGNRIDEVLREHGLHYYEILLEGDTSTHEHHTLIVA